MPSIAHLKQKKQIILNELELARIYKTKTIAFVNSLESQFHDKRISNAEFKYKLNKTLKNKSLKEWIDYYDNLIYTKTNEINSINNELKKFDSTRFVSTVLLLTLILILMSITSFVFIKPQITGLAVYQPGVIVSEIVTLSINQNITIENTIVKAKLNNQEVNLPLTNFKLIENLVTIDLEQFNILAEEGTLVVEIIYNNDVIATTSLDISLEQIKENITLQEPVEEKISPQINVTNISRDLNKVKQRLEKDRVKIKDAKLIDNKYKVEVEFTTQTANKKGGIEINGLENIDDLREIKIGKPLDNKFRRTSIKGIINTDVVAVNSGIIENATITLPKNGKINTIVKCSNFDFNSFICDDWAQTDIQFIDDGTNIIFTVDEFSAYAGAVIEIIKAEHLDNNRNFISDIYNETKKFDNIWSETIPENHYVRVKFEKRLLPFNDISIYPRTVSGNPKIRVFEAEQNILIAEFININDNQYNKVLLTNLQGSQDTFDLQVLDGSVEFDHIVDPLIITTSRRYNITSFPPQPNIWTVFNRSGQNLANPPAATAAHDGSNDTNTECGQPNNLRQSDDIRCVLTERGTNVEPWIRFNFTIQEDPNTITSVRIVLEGLSGSTDAVAFIHWNNTQGVWSRFGGTTTTTEVTRQITYTTATDIDNVIGNAGDMAPNQILILFEGTNHDAAETIAVDFVQVEVNATVIVNSEPYFKGGYPQLNSSNGLNTTIKNLTVYFVPLDNENTTLGYNITWLKNNISQFTLPIPIQTTNNGTLNFSVLDFRNLSEDETWRAQVALFDGGFVNYTNTSEIKILRYALVIESPKTASPLTTNAGKNVTIQYNYSISGINQSEGSNVINITIGGVFANILGEWYDGAWKVNVTIPSGLIGLQTLTLNATLNEVVRNDTQINAINIEEVTNNPPNTPSNLVINSTNILQTNLTTENLQVRFDVSDPDPSDTLNYSIQWFKNNITQFIFTNLAVNNPGTAVQTLQHQNTTRGDLWSAQVLVCDNNNACSAFVNTSQLLILNARPNATTNLQPLNNTKIKTLTPILNWTNSSDLDNDILSYELDISTDSSFSTITYNAFATNITGSPGLVGGFTTMITTIAPNPRGLTTNGSDFWIADTDSDYIYHINAFGQNVTGSPGLIGGFSARSAASAATVSPASITTNGSDFWVLDFNDYVYHFNAFGNNITGSPGLVGGFDAKIGGGVDVRGITTNGSDFWISDFAGVQYIYHVNAFGQNVTGSPGLIGGFSGSVAADSISPHGITTNGSDFWFVSNFEDFLFHVNAFGQNISSGYESGIDLKKAIQSSTINPQGLDTITRLNPKNLNIVNDLYVTDRANSLYVYHFALRIPEGNLNTNRTNHTIATNLQDNTNYYWRVRAYDGSYSDYAYGNFTINVNTAPNTPSNLVINSTNILQTNYTDEDLRMNFLCDDPDDADILTFHLTAFRNYINTFQLQGPCNDPEYKSIILDNKNTTKFDNWSFSVNVSDASGAYSSTISSVVNLTIRNSLPIIGNVTLDMADNIDLIEAGNKTILFSFIATDADNFTDINNFSAVANISRTGETTRYNDTFVNPNDGGCHATNNYGENSKNFSCSINIVFYDGAGEWNISVRINDTNSFAQNITKTFTINELTALQINQNTFTFPLITPNQFNISSLINITLINTGNDDISGREATGETINITAITLVPASGSTFIPASNFTIGQVNSTTGHIMNHCDPSIVANVTRLQNTTIAQGYANFTGAINGSALRKGATNNVHTLGLCLMHAPSNLESTTYSTSYSGAWTIIIFYFRRRKNIYEKNKKIINSLIEIKIFNKLSDKEIVNLINYKDLIPIPISIFKNSSPLESLVKYLKDNLGLTLNEIASLLERDQRTIWVTYNNAIKKKIVLDASSEITIPIEVFADRKYSLLENLVSYLLDQDYEISEISKLLNRDYKTIWTCYNRAKEKMKIEKYL